MEQVIGGIVLSILMVVAIFLIFRSLALWYWRVNTIIAKLDGILEELRSARGHSASVVLPHQPIPPGQMVKCKSCGTETRSEAGFCRSCGIPLK